MGFEDFSFLSFPEFGFLKALAWELWLEDPEVGGTGWRVPGEPGWPLPVTGSLKRDMPKIKKQKPCQADRRNHDRIGF